MSTRFGYTELPPEQERSLRRAVHVQWWSIAFLVTATVVVYLVLGSSQALKAAWIEDLLSFVPPIAFLVATRTIKRPPTAEHPFGFHRAIGIAHLVAGVALLTMGTYLVYDSGSKLVAAEHPPIGSVEVFGQVIWSGWLMIAAMAYTAVPPVILGRLKMRLAEELHDKVLYADAAMNRADWMTAVGAIVGILGIGIGLWWADSVAALAISFSILRDGISNVRGATRGLIDARARTFDDAQPHPLVRDVDRLLEGMPWIARAASRLRDEGHVFHSECFVVPIAGTADLLERLEEARRAVKDLDWKLQDVVLVAVSELPSDLLPESV